MREIQTKWHRNGGVIGYSEPYRNATAEFRTVRAVTRRVGISTKRWPCVSFRWLVRKNTTPFRPSAQAVGPPLNALSANTLTPLSPSVSLLINKHNNTLDFSFLFFFGSTNVWVLSTHTL